MLTQPFFACSNCSSRCMMLSPWPMSLDVLRAITAALGWLLVSKAQCLINSCATLGVRFRIIAAGPGVRSVAHASGTSELGAVSFVWFSKSIQSWKGCMLRKTLRNPERNLPCAKCQQGFLSERCWRLEYRCLCITKSFMANLHRATPHIQFNKSILEQAFQDSLVLGTLF